ncbi:MAG: Mu-like prophage major head subunit gpT family protein [Phycisphaerae bacterium]|nr:Mu-like prophage major head subunit gpT family protein [Phycisphaerae bacterium]
MPNVGRIVKTNHSDLYDLNIGNQFLQGYGEAEHEFEDVYNVVNITHQDTRYSHISGLGVWPVKPFGANVTFDGIYQGYDVTITPKTYASAYTVEKETIDDDPTGLLTGPLSQSHGQMARETMEILAAVPFNSATTATIFEWCSAASGAGYLGDGKALLATDHPILSGGTYANTPSSAADLSISSLQASLIRLNKMQGARGQQWPLQGEMVVVPVDSRFLLDELLDGDKMPYTADNTVNSVRGLLKKKVWSRLTDPDSWFVLAGKAGKPGAKGHGLVAVIRQMPEFRKDNVFASGDRQYAGDFRIGFGAYDFRGVDGSIGAG